MTRKEEIIILWQLVNLMRDIQRLLNSHYFDEFMDLDEKERTEAYRNEWLFPDLAG